MRRMKKARIKFLSLVPRGATQLPVVYKEDGAFEVSLLTKTMDDKGEILAVVYAPELRDSQGDIASAEVIKEMAYAAAKEGVEIDVRHDGKPVGKDRAYVAETFIVQKGDIRFEGFKDYSGKLADVAGAWGVVLKVEDEDLRKQYRDGGWEGISMGGRAEMDAEKNDNTGQRFWDFLQKLLVNPPSKTGPTGGDQEDDVALTDEDLKKICETTATAVVAAMKKGENPPPKDPPKDPEVAAAPVFKGDPTDVEALKAHREELKKHLLSQRLAKAKTTEEFDKILKEVEDGENPAPPADPGTKHSRQPAPGAGDNTGTTAPVGVTKEEAGHAKIGSAMAAYANKDSGY